MKILLVFISVICLLSSKIEAQNTAMKWSEAKLIGSRYLKGSTYRGERYFINDWEKATIYLANGEVVPDVHVKYSTYIGSLIYINENTMDIVKIDDHIIKGFDIFSGGEKYSFIRKYFDGFFSGYRFFQVLYEGKNSLLLHKTSNLVNSSMTYISKSGQEKISEFVSKKRIYIHNEKNGYRLIQPKNGSFFNKFSKSDKKEIKKLLRKNRTRIYDEFSLVKAWQIVEEAGFKPLY